MIRINEILQHAGRLNNFICDAVHYHEKCAQTKYLGFKKVLLINKIGVYKRSIIFYQSVRE
jgi:hypothetical protein